MCISLKIKRVDESLSSYQRRLDMLVYLCWTLVYLKIAPETSANRCHMSLLEARNILFAGDLKDHIVLIQFHSQFSEGMNQSASNRAW